MQEAYRVMDANFNRAREGLRVLEEIARFVFEDAALSAELKDLRHRLTKLTGELPGGLRELVSSRDSAHDVGAESWTAGEKNRTDMFSLAAANIKRVQEASRVLEEFGKLFMPNADEFKKIRFQSYGIEKKLMARLAAGNTAETAID